MHYYQRGKREGKREKGGSERQRKNQLVPQMKCQTLWAVERAALPKMLMKRYASPKHSHTHTHREGKGVEQNEKAQKENEKKRGKQEDSKTIFMFILQN